METPKPEQKLAKVNRRQFLKGAVVATAAAGAYLSDLFGKSVFAQEGTVPIAPVDSAVATVTPFAQDGTAKPPNSLAEAAVEAEAAEAEVSPEAIKNLSQALARGWIRSDESKVIGLAGEVKDYDAGGNIPTNWENAAKSALALCDYLYKNRDRIAPMASDTFPSVHLDPASPIYYDVLAVRRTQLKSINLCLPVAVLATENTDQMRILNCYIGMEARGTFDPGNLPSNYYSLEGGVWQMQNFILGLRAIQGLFLAPGGSGPFPFDVTQGGLNVELMRKYNSANPWWARRVTSIYNSVLSMAQNIPGMEYLAENLIPNQEPPQTSA